MAKGILNNFFGINEENDNTKKNTQVAVNPRKVLSMSDNRIPDSKINIVEPRVFGDAKSIANKLMNGSAILMKMENIDESVVRRIIDFLNGALYAIDGNIQKIDDKVFLCLPNNYSVDGSVKQQFYNQPRNKK